MKDQYLPSQKQEIVLGKDINIPSRYQLSINYIAAYNVATQLQPTMWQYNKIQLN